MKLNKVYLGNCIDLMKSFPEKSVDLIFADPPFNIGIKYDRYQDNLTYDQYYDWSQLWMEEAYRTLKDKGSIYVAIGDEFAAEINILLKKLGFYYRNWIIWYYTFGQNQRKKFNRSHTHIMYFTKNKENFTFNNDEIRVPSARQLVYNDKRANPKGKVPDDVWQFSRVCGTFKERFKNHPCQMPELLLERIIQVSSNTDDLVLDPFGGTGTTAAVAKKLARHYITMDVSEEYYNLILNRLDSNEKGLKQAVSHNEEVQINLFNV